MRVDAHFDQSNTMRFSKQFEPNPGFDFWADATFGYKWGNGQDTSGAIRLFWAYGINSGAIAGDGMSFYLPDNISDNNAFFAYEQTWNDGQVGLLVQNLLAGGEIPEECYITGPDPIPDPGDTVIYTQSQYTMTLPTTTEVSGFTRKEPYDAPGVILQPGRSFATWFKDGQVYWSGTTAPLSSVRAPNQSTYVNTFSLAVHNYEIPLPIIEGDNLIADRRFVER